MAYAQTILRSQLGMCRAVCALLLAAMLAAQAARADSPPTTTQSVTVAAPAFPTPMQMSIIGLSITAIAAIGARVSNRNSDTMMYMVLASLAVTALMVVFADKQYKAYDRVRFEVWKQLHQRPATEAEKAG